MSSASVGPRNGTRGKRTKNLRKNPAHIRNAANGIWRSQLPADSTEESADWSEFSPAERKIVDAIQDALDDDDFDRVSAQLSAAVASTNAAVRAKAVDALNWFGEKALPELTLFMADEDDDVRAAALDAWEMGLSQMEAGEEKSRAVQMGLSVVTDKERLELMVGQLDNLADEQKIGVLAATIEGKNKTAAQVARECYKFWTDEDYTDLAAAQRWLDERLDEDAE